MSAFVCFVHGQNGYYNAAIYPFNRWTLASALVISSGAVLLDSLKQSAGLPLYSFPKEVKTSCDNGKNYHFWVPAYMTRDAHIKAHMSKDSSQWSSFIPEVGYQMLSRSQGRDPVGNISSAFNSLSNQKNRLDLAFAAMGTEFARGSKKEVNVDQSFDQMYNRSKKYRPVDRKVAEKLKLSTFALRYHQLMHPKQALKALQ
jgi:hypothetical protein